MLAPVALAAVLAPAACRKEYAHEDLGAASPQARAVREMIDALRAAGEEGLERTAASQAAGGLDDRRRAALHAALGEIARAGEVELVRLDRFGRRVYRASLRLGAGEAAQTMHLLLVEEDGALRWAGPN